MTEQHIYDVVVVGGGPCGATVATDLAKAGRSVLLLDRAGRIKPCGGAIPPRLIRDFDIPDDIIVAKVNSALMVSPSGQRVDMPIDGNGFVGMVDREVFDEWLRERAGLSGAERRTGTFETITRAFDGTVLVHYRAKGDPEKGPCEQIRCRLVIGADGARSAVGRREIPGAERVPCVFAYHEIVEWPKEASEAVDARRCDVYYDGRFSPDFYSWIFPHGTTMSIGTGSANKGFSLRGAVKDLRDLTGLDGMTTIRREGAPIPLKPLKKWDNGKDVLLAGDAAGVVAPASGEGIYYAMLSGRLAAEAAERTLATGDARNLALARKRFMKTHGRVFWILGIMQYFWYSSDKRRERFVSMCRDKDVQKLTWDSYMNKELVRKDPLAHVKIFFKDMAHLLGLLPAVDAEARRNGRPPRGAVAAVTSSLADFFSSGRIADLVLVFMAIEVVVLVALRVVARRGVPLGDLVWITASGACLVLALRAALTGAGWWWIGLALSGSLASHLMDLRRRWSPSAT